MKRTRSGFVFILLLMVLMLSACAGFQEKWNALSPDEKARTVVNGMQIQLENLFNTGQQYVNSHPEKRDVWKSKALPAFDAANKALGNFIRMFQMGQAQGLTPDIVYSQMTPLITAVTNALVTMGALK